MKTITVSEASTQAIDWLVAKCEEASGRDNAETWLCDYRIGFTTRYSTKWPHGGPIIESEGIHLLCNDDQTEWLAIAPHSNPRLVGWRTHAYGPTPLIAAMRVYVIGKLGDVVDVPDELV